MSRLSAWSLLCSRRQVAAVSRNQRHRNLSSFPILIDRIQSSPTINNKFHDNIKKQRRWHTTSIISNSNYDNDKLFLRDSGKRSRSDSNAMPGLYSIPGLLQPNDFLRLAQEAIQESNTLRGHIAATTERFSDSSSPPELTADIAIESLYVLDLISKTVCNVIDAAELCRSTHVSSEWRDVATVVFGQLQEYIGQLNSDENLYQCLVMIENNTNIYQHSLTEEEQRFCSLLKREFELDGIHLPTNQRQQVQDRHGQVSALETLYMNNITNSQKRFWLPSSSLESVIPRHVLQVNGATYNDDYSKVQIGVNTPIAQSISNFAQDGKLRQDVYMESVTSCTENLSVLDDLIQSRYELATSLGFPSYAHRFLQDKMVQTPDMVHQFLSTVEKQISSTYVEELELIRRYKQKLEGDCENGVVVEPWDIKFYVKLIKAQMAGVDLSQDLAPYWSLSNCISAMQILVKELFGIEMKEDTNMLQSERWDVDNNTTSSSTQQEAIRKFIFYESETQRELGTMYLDLHPRPGKYTHAAHFTVRCGCVKDGRYDRTDYQLPIVALVCNMNSGHASFSTHQEVETLFHEFGHALHSLLSRTKFQHLSGTRGAMDFVETPSHWMEHYVWDTNFVQQHLAKSVMDGTSMPQSLIQALVQSRNIFRCLEMQNQIVLSRFDQTIFGVPTESMSTKEIWSSLHRQHNVPFVAGTHWYTNVGHLVSYGAGYYGYLHAQVFATAIWNDLFEGQPLNRNAGDKLWKNVLIHGGAKDANHMLHDLLGRKPTINENYWGKLRSQ